jgi:hypothetical protein
MSQSGRLRATAKVTTPTNDIAFSSIISSISLAPFQDSVVQRREQDVCHTAMAKNRPIEDQPGADTAGSLPDFPTTQA